MPRIILLEGLPKYEGVNEAEALADALKLMKKSCDGRRARYLRIDSHYAKNKEDFIEWLQKETDFLHISAHGNRENGKTVLNITRGGKITPEEIEELDIKAKVVFVNACMQSHKDMADAFFEAGKPRLKFFIAPKREVSFSDAFIIALLFYKKTFIEKAKSLSNALRYVYNLKDIKTSYWLWKE